MSGLLNAKSFHQLADLEPGLLSTGVTAEPAATTKYYVVQERDVSYRFYPHYHPYSGELTKRLVTGSTKRLQAADTEYVTAADGSVEMLPDGKPRPLLQSDIFSALRYAPSALVQQPYPVADLDFTSSGAYSDYNYELFFHVPLTIAIHLSRNQRFAEAQQWFHYIFDPTDDSNGPTPQRFWKVRPFQYSDVGKIEEILVNLATGTDPDLRDETIRSIEAWKDQPFQPHVIARYRQQAYMYKTVMAYLDNLIAWGDALFRQDTGEAIDEALMLYVLAANILGPKPLAVPKKGTVRPQTYANLRADLDKFGNAMRDLEVDIPFDIAPFPTASAAGSEAFVALRSMSKALYFAVPRNDKLLGYWDTVADRLFKIHNSLNLQGVFRQLALFAPPIDPALLARATAAGLDIAAVVNGANQPLPLARFALLAQLAADACQEVKAFGAALLSAIEKEDGEQLGLIRARQESAMLALGEQVRFAQVQEATKSTEGLVRSLAVAVQRYSYYERQLGKKAADIEAAIPPLDDLDRSALEAMSLTSSEPEIPVRDIAVDIATGALADASGALAGGKLLSSHEVHEALLLEGAQLSSDVGNVLAFFGSIAHVAPTVQVNAQPLGVGSTVEFGGENIGNAMQSASSAARAVAERLNFEARRASRIDGFARREREWAFQSNLAAGEIGQIFKQLRAAQLRQAIAEMELRNHRKQIEHAGEIERFLNAEGTQTDGKTSNKALYTWMKRETKALYTQCFQFAFDAARRAERALQHELGSGELKYLQYDYQAGNEGLLAGEKLHFDLRRMQAAYHELNAREYEMVRHVSLLQVSPMALLQLRRTGKCTVSLPEVLFDLDAPGHYFRRIRHAAVTIPCVTGPYASLNCTLTLLKSSIRTSPALAEDTASGGYARGGAEDLRFSDYFGRVESIVTSSAQNDPGLFEVSLRDERYLPFEYAGAVSDWQIELAGNPSVGEPLQFDYDTISDVILHIHYTARAGGQPLRQQAMAAVRDAIAVGEAIGSTRLFSLRHEFPSEWARFKEEPAAPGDRYRLALQLREEHYPFWSRGRLDDIGRVRLAARSSKEPPPAELKVFDTLNDATGNAKSDTLTRDDQLGKLLVGTLAKLAPLDKPTGEIELFLPTNELKDVWIAVDWRGKV